MKKRGNEKRKNEDGQWDNEGFLFWMCNGYEKEVRFTAHRRYEVMNTKLSGNLFLHGAGKARGLGSFFVFDALWKGMTRDMESPRAT
jgi:hypothetical protein